MAAATTETAEGAAPSQSQRDAEHIAGHASAPLVATRRALNAAPTTVRISAAAYAMLKRDRKALRAAHRAAVERARASEGELADAKAALAATRAHAAAHSAAHADAQPRSQTQTPIDTERTDVPAAMEPACSVVRPPLAVAAAPVRTYPILAVKTKKRTDAGHDRGADDDAPQRQVTPAAERAATWDTTRLGSVGDRTALRMLTLEAPTDGGLPRGEWHYVHFIVADTARAYEDDNTTTVTKPMRRRILGRLKDAAISHGPASVGAAFPLDRASAAYEGDNILHPTAARTRIVALIADGWSVVRDSAATCSLVDAAALRDMEAEGAARRALAAEAAAPAMAAAAKMAWRPLAPEVEVARSERERRRRSGKLHAYEVAMLREEDNALGIICNEYCVVTWLLDAFTELHTEERFRRTPPRQTARWCPHNYDNAGFTAADAEELRLRDADTGAMAWVERVERDQMRRPIDKRLRLDVYKAALRWETSDALVEWGQREAAVRRDAIKELFWLDWVKVDFERRAAAARQYPDANARVAALCRERDARVAAFHAEAGERAARARASREAQRDRIAAEQANAAARAAAHRTEDEASAQAADDARKASAVLAAVAAAARTKHPRLA